MIKRYSLQESLINEEQKGLFLNSSSASVLNIFRALSGSTTIKDEYTDTEINHNFNYFSSPYSQHEEIPTDLVLDIFSDTDMTIEDISDSFLQIKKYNKDFYEALEPEVLNCILARSQGRYLESFVFLYRILEGISYSIPLMYTAKSSSFTKSFDALRKYIKKDNGEIAFFKKFLSEEYHDADFYKVTMDISLDEISIEELRKAYFKIYKDKLNAIKSNPLKSEIEDEELSVSFLGYFEFLIEIRNRYFHFLQGTWQNNIASNQIVYPDLFFKPLIDNGINWIAIIFLEVIKFEIDERT